MRTRVKVCGFTREQDIEAAVAAGVDAIGLVFYRHSARCVSIEQAQTLRAQIPAFVSTVCLFVNAAPAEVQAVIEHVRPDLLQFHGDEPAQYCDSFKHPYLKALRVGAPGLETGSNLLAQAQQYQSSQGLLLDAYTPAYGGSGTAFDPLILDQMQAIQAQQARRLPVCIVAGGMRVENVTERIQRWRPYAIDVSSGVEDAPGIKNANKMQEFMRVVTQAR